MSLALFVLSLLIILDTCFSVTCLSVNGGWVVWFVFSGCSLWICSFGSVYCGIVSFVLVAMVM